MRSIAIHHIPMKADVKRWLSGVFLFLTFLFSQGEPITYLDLRSLLQKNYADSIEVLDVWDNLHTIATLQGIVNRKHPRLYINYIVTGKLQTDTHWWQLYRKPGQWLAGRDTIACHSVEEAVSIYRKDIKGAVVYDPRIASTSNVASAVAGAEDLIAVRYDKRPQSLYSRLVEGESKLPVKVWLVGTDGTSIFTGRGMLPDCNRPSSGSTKCDPYLWLIEKYMKSKRLSGQCAGYYIDQQWRNMVFNSEANHHTLTNHDYFVAHKGFFFDLSPWGDEAATDDPLQPIGSDYATLTELLQQAFLLNGGKKMCHIGGFPAWAYKYTKHVDGSHEDVATEWQFSELISHYNAFEDADAIGYGALANASFWQHFPLRKTYPQAWVSRDKPKFRKWIGNDGKVDTTRNYVIVYIGDYDASSWLSQMTPTLWDSPERGKLPMMWSISPILADRTPHVMHYIRQTASPNDYFVSADNGAGYMMPGVAEQHDMQEGTTKRLDTWKRHCSRYYKQWGLTVTGFIIDGNGPGLGKQGLECYTHFSPNGIIPQKCPPISFYKNMPIVASDYDIVDTDPKTAARVMVNRIATRKVPFHWFRCILKSPNWYQEVINEAKKLDPSIELLDAPTFFELIRYWKSKP